MKPKQWSGDEAAGAPEAGGRGRDQMRFDRRQGGRLAGGLDACRPQMTQLECRCTGRLRQGDQVAAVPEQGLTGLKRFRRGVSG